MTSSAMCQRRPAHIEIWLGTVLLSTTRPIILVLLVLVLLIVVLLIMVLLILVVLLLVLLLLVFLVCLLYYPMMVLLEVGNFLWRTISRRIVRRWRLIFVLWRWCLCRVWSFLCRFCSLLRRYDVVGNDAFLAPLAYFGQRWFTGLWRREVWR
jgi:hypothetical protein